jgi:hypothetical protein
MDAENERAGSNIFKHFICHGKLDIVQSNQPNPPNLRHGDNAFALSREIDSSNAARAAHIRCGIQE